MIKKNKVKTLAVSKITDEEKKSVSKFFSSMKDKPRMDLENNIKEYENTIKNFESNVQYHQEQVDECKARSVICAKDLVDLKNKLSKLPKMVVSVADVDNEIEKILSLSWVASVEIVGSTIKWLKIITRPNSLFTTMTQRVRKLSRGCQFYRTRPYKLALPAYEIHFGLIPCRTVSNNENILKIRFADFESDTSNFLSDFGYGQEPHAHWATPNAGRTDNNFRDMCMGEYESDVTRAFQKSISDGLVALSIFLQTAGYSSAHISNKTRWALWIGKKEYNKLITPQNQKEEVGEGIEEAEEYGSSDDEF